MVSLGLEGLADSRHLRWCSQCVNVTFFPILESGLETLCLRNYYRLLGLPFRHNTDPELLGLLTLEAADSREELLLRLCVVVFNGV